MKKVFLVLSIAFIGFAGRAQDKITAEQSRIICAQEMAAFKNAVSGSYKKGNSFEQFQLALCGQSLPAAEGTAQLKVAYNFLTQGVSNDFIIKTYNGKEVAASMNFLSKLHSKGIVSDGSELFGEKTGTANSTLAKSSADGCRWYQFWCLVQGFANWIINNWTVIVQIITFVNSGIIP